jgi:hypothetical protein
VRTKFVIFTKKGPVGEIFEESKDMAVELFAALNELNPKDLFARVAKKSKRWPGYVREPGDPPERDED